MAIAVVIPGFGAPNGWVMISAEVPLAAAKDGLFPERFTRMSKNGVPAAGIVVSALTPNLPPSARRWALPAARVLE